jgi:hypothetical protein
MTLETMRELFGVAHVGEEEDPNAKRMRVGEEEVPLSQSITITVPSEDEEVRVPQGLTIVVPSEEVVLLVLQGPPVVVPLKEGEAMPT